MLPASDNADYIHPTNNANGADKLNQYAISHLYTGAKMGRHDGTHRGNALGNMARAAGYRDYEHAKQADPKTYSDLRVIEII
jgi:hypothetical protein